MLSNQMVLGRLKNRKENFLSLKIRAIEIDLYDIDNYI